MLWFFLSLATALFSASEAAYLKGFLSDRGPWVLACHPPFYAAPLFAATLLLQPVPELQPGFWLTLALVLPVNVAGFLLHMRAIHESPISLTMPLQSFTPVFVIATGYLLLSEQPSLAGAAGILCIVSGSYVLNMDGGGSALAPFRALVRDKGSRCMLAAAFLYSLASVLGKQLVLQSSPFFGGELLFLLFGVVMVPGLILCGKVRLRELTERPLRGLGAGLILYGHILFHYSAVALVNTAYMMAIKRLNGLFSVLYGGLFFKEGNFGYRLAGATLMGLGAAVIALWG